MGKSRISRSNLRVCNTVHHSLEASFQYKQETVNHMGTLLNLTAGSITWSVITETLEQKELGLKKRR